MSFGVGDNLCQFYSHTLGGSTAPTALCIRPLKQTARLSVSKVWWLN